MSQSYTHLGNSASPATDFITLPEKLSIWAFRNRKKGALTLFCRLKFAFRPGWGRITETELLRLSGLKQVVTLRKYLAQLASVGLLYYRDGKLRLFNPVRYFGSSTGAPVTRVFFNDLKDIFHVLFSSLSRLVDDRNKTSARKCLTRRGIYDYAHNLGGVSCRSLASILNYSPVRISQFKKSCPFLRCKHRYIATTYTPFELRHIRNDDPALGRTLQNMGGKIMQQIVDEFEWLGVETTWRSL